MWNNKTVSLVMITILVLSTYSISIIYKAEGTHSSDLGSIDDEKKLGLMDNIDQSQEKNDGEIKIYGGKRVAQSFIPTMGNLTKIEILIRCTHETHWLVELVRNLAQSFPFLEYLIPLLEQRLLNLPGHLIISLFGSQDGVPEEQMCDTTINRDVIPQENEWLVFDFSDIGVYAGREYCISCTASWGDDSNCYQWCYGLGDPYVGGKAVSSSDSGLSWDEITNVDFCFRTYGEYTGEEPDGVEQRWAVLTYDPDLNFGNNIVSKNDCNNYRNNFLKYPEWKSGNIWIYNYDTEWSMVRDKLLELDQYENGDDIIVFIYVGHTEGLSWTNQYFNRYGSTIAIIIDCCYAASRGAGESLKVSGREILFGSDSDSKSCYFEHGALFSYYLNMGLNDPSTDTNNDKWISTREAFNYAKPRVGSQNPQFYDGIPDYDIPLVSTTWP